MVRRFLLSWEDGNEPKPCLSRLYSTVEFVLTSTNLFTSVGQGNILQQTDRLTPSGSYNFLNDKTIWGLIYTSSVFGTGILSKHFKGCVHTNTTPGVMFCTYLIFNEDHYIELNVIHSGINWENKQQIFTENCLLNSKQFRLILDIFVKMKKGNIIILPGD